MKYLLVVCALLVAACTPPAPMTAPAPTRITTPRLPVAVVQASVEALAVRGFTVTTADGASGIVIANRSIQTGEADHAKEVLACRWGPDAIGWNAIGGTITVTVTARSAAPGSAVSIVGVTRTAARLGYGRIADPGADDGSCVSNGKVEAAIGEAVAAP